MKYLFPDLPKLRVFGLFGCSHKTIAMGIPLIDAMYGKSPAVGLYTLPLLVWYPMILVIGSMLVPYLSKFVETEEERLALRLIQDQEMSLRDTDVEAGENRKIEIIKTEALVSGGYDEKGVSSVKADDQKSSAD
jgi:hypothetical protein